MCKDGYVSYVMKVLWKVLCISLYCGEFVGDRGRFECD